MIVNNKHRFVFVHVPKTAGTSIRRALEGLPGIDRGIKNPQTKHETAREFLGRIKKDIYYEYYFFAFVRNPWDRFASLHRYLLKNNSRFEFPIPDGVSEFAMMLDERIPWVEKLHSVRPQSDFIESYFSFVGRFEAIDHDFQRICGQLSISPPLPHLNATAFQPIDFRPLFTRRAAKIVGDRYALDIRSFGYSY